MNKTAIVVAVFATMFTCLAASAASFDPFERAMFRPADRSHALISMLFVANEAELKRECAQYGVFNVSESLGYCHHWSPRELTDGCAIVTLAGSDALSHVIRGMVRCTSESIESRKPEGQDRDLALMHAQSALGFEPTYDQRMQFNRDLFKHGWVILQPSELSEIAPLCRERFPSETYPDGLAVCTYWRRKSEVETCHSSIMKEGVGEITPLTVTMSAMRGCNKSREP